MASRHGLRGRLALLVLVTVVCTGDVNAGFERSACNRQALVLSANGKARFCILTDHIIRMEWASTPQEFRDESTMRIQTRMMDNVPRFQAGDTGHRTVITSSDKLFEVEYDYQAAPDDSFSDQNLKVTMGDLRQTWSPSVTDKVLRDAMPGTIRTLDMVNGAVSLACLEQGAESVRDNHCTYGLFSRKRGYTVIDDTLSATLDQDPQWPWLKKASVQRKAASCSIPASERQICGYETVDKAQCIAQGCCYSPDPVSSFSNGSNAAPAFHCYYSTSSYKDLYLIFHGHNYRQALREFTWLSGKMPIPPRFAFGVYYSRWWAYSDADVKHKIVAQYEQRSLPLDVVVLDMDWHLTFYTEKKPDQSGQPKGWTGFTWDRALFPDPPRLLRWLHNKGLHVTLNLHPASGVQPWEDSYEIVATAMGIDPKTQKYVPFRITDKNFAQTWLDMTIAQREQDGVDFWWLDWQQGEDWIQRYENRSDINPTLWLNYVFFTSPYHWQRTTARPMLLHRFGGLGNHRYPVGFSGDVIATWASLKFQPYFTAMAANVAFGYWSHDLGGFQNPTEPELFARWLQWGAFAPIFRTHSSKSSLSDRRIWKYSDEIYEVARAAMKLRASMVPYIYHAAKEAHDSGVSIVHGLFLDWPEHDEAYNFTQQYMFGSSMLVSPVVEPVANDTHLASKSIWVPPGLWYDFMTGNLIQGPVVYSLGYTLSEIPRLAKAGSIITMTHEGSEGRSETVGQLTHAPSFLHLLVLPGDLDSVRQDLYEDDGLSKEYLAGQTASTSFEFRSSNCTASSYGGSDTFIIHAVNGSYGSMPQRRSYKVEFRGTLPAKSVTFNGKYLRELQLSDDVEVSEDGFTYAPETLSVVVWLVTPVSVTVNVAISIEYITTIIDKSKLVTEGIVGKISRLHAVKDLLDSQWGVDTVFMSDYPSVLKAAEMDERLLYDPSNFTRELLGFNMVFDAAIRELKALPKLKDSVRAQALAYLNVPELRRHKIIHESTSIMSVE